MNIESIVKDAVYSLFLVRFPVGYFHIDTNGIVLDCNDIELEILEIKNKNDFLGKNLFKMDFITKGGKDNCKKTMRSACANAYEECHVLKNGHKKYFYSIKKPIFENNKVVSLIGIGVDITDIKKTEFELAEALKKSELSVKTHKTIFENMKHNLITAVSDIKVSLEPIVEEEISVEETREFVSNALTGTNSLHKHISDILELVFSGEGVPPVTSKPINLVEIATFVKDMFIPGIKRKKLNFIFDTAGIPELVRGDKYRIERIMMYLLGNAVKFSNEHGKLLFAIKIISETNNDYSISIEIKDTGIGMGPKEVAHIYEPFYRGTPAYQTRLKNTGNGVGLSIVKQYIDQMNGQIDCSSTLGNGTTFLIGLRVSKSILPKKLLEKAGIT